MLSIPSTHSSPQDVKKLKHAFNLVISFTLLLWAIKLFEVLFGITLWWFTINPGQIFGLVGILIAPLVHGSFEHLISNTPAIFILGIALIYGYPKSYKYVIPIIWLFTGLGVWLTARPLFHFGASGLTYGLMAFIFIIGMLRRDRLAIALSLIVFFLYGSMIWGVFPHLPGISYETHLWGAGLGALCAIVLRNHDPAPAIKRFDWEDEDENDPIIDDAWEKHDNKTHTRNEK